jgi:hypothetical protein
VEAFVVRSDGEEAKKFCLGNQGVMKLFELMSTLFPIFFIIVFGFILFNIFRGIREWSYNNQQPVLTVEAKLVAKRQHVSRNSHNHDGHVHHSSNTSYYATFEVQSGDRMEFRVNGNEYGMLAEGDFGSLTFQGSRYHGFDRHPSAMSDR